MVTKRLDQMRELIQEDVGNRGLKTDPHENLINACPDDFRLACESLATGNNLSVGVVTGFYIPHAKPPCGETDGPLGAIFLARALAPLGFKVTLITDPFCLHSLEVGLTAVGLSEGVRLVSLPISAKTLGELSLTHLIALERVGPSHSVASIRNQSMNNRDLEERFRQEVAKEHWDRCHTMRGRDITENMAPAHRLFEPSFRKMYPYITIGIGDGGNEIGMGKIPWEIIRKNIKPCGGLVACRVPTDHLIACGISNWGAYALGAGVRLSRGVPVDPALFDPEREREILKAMVERGPLVDGMTGERTVSVDGLAFERYVKPLLELSKLAMNAKR